jgi:membrane protein YdbS with pleckstrin-like domain
MNKNDMQKLNIRALWLMLLSSAIGAVFVTLLVAFSWFALSEGMPKEILPAAKWIKTLILFIVWVYTVASPLIRYERYRYIFSDEEIRVREGLWWVKTFVVPIERLHQVEMQSGPLDQMFRFTKIIVTTAGGNGVVRFIEIDRAEELVESLKTRINSYAVKGRGKNPNAFAPKEAPVDAVNIANDTVSDVNSDDLV